MYQNTLERAVSNRRYLNRTNCPQFPLPQIEMYISRTNWIKNEQICISQPLFSFLLQNAPSKSFKPPKKKTPLFTWASAHPPLSQQKGLHSKRILSPRALCLSPCKFVGQISKELLDRARRSRRVLINNNNTGSYVHWAYLLLPEILPAVINPSLSFIGHSLSIFEKRW